MKKTKGRRKNGVSSLVGNDARVSQRLNPLAFKCTKSPGNIRRRVNKPFNRKNPDYALLLLKWIDVV